MRESNAAGKGSRQAKHSFDAQRTAFALHEPVRLYWNTCSNGANGLVLLARDVSVSDLCQKSCSPVYFESAEV